MSRALATEARAAQEFSHSNHPMRYLLRKSSPRLTSTKEIAETADGDVARLLEINDQPLSPADEQKEQARLDALLSDPQLQQHRKQSEDSDTERALKVLRVLPTAFLYQFAGTGTGPRRNSGKFTFRPNPKFDPPDLETGVLTAMAGEIWIDPVQERVVRLAGSLQQDKDFGWGILGELDKGGWVEIDQADVGGHQWRIVHLKLVMNGCVLFKTKNSDSVQDYSQFAPLPAESELPPGHPDAARRPRQRSAERTVNPDCSKSEERPHPQRVGPFCLSRMQPGYIFGKTMTRVNRVRDSISARPRIRKVKIAGRAPGLRATASTAEPTALP